MDDEDEHFEPDLHHGREAAVGALRCDNCGSYSYRTNDVGDVVCDYCGTQSQDVRTIEQEEHTGGGLARTRSGAAVVRRTKRVPRAALPTTRDAFSTQALLGALQRVLDAEVSALVRVCGCPPELRDAAARVWFGFLERWAAAPGSPPPAVVVDSHLATGTQMQYWAALHAAGLHGPPRCPPLSLGLLLCVCYASCRLLSLPILPHDLCAWTRNGTLPFLNAYAALSPSLQAAVAVGRALFSPTGPPSPPWIARMTDVLCASVGVALPPVNSPACAARLVNLTRLPAAIVPIAAALCVFDSRDRAQQAQVDPPPGPRSRDPLETLRRALRGEAPASYVAGAVATAARLTPGWQGWVRSHLLSPSPGKDGAGVQRARAACTVGPWGKNLNCGARDGSPGRDPVVSPVVTSSSPPYVPHPDVLLPWTTAQTLAMPRELTEAYIRCVGSSILHGGDVEPGRGESGYERGRYGPGAAATVTIADAREAEELERRVAMRTATGAAAAEAAAVSQARDVETGLLALLMGDSEEDVAEAEAIAAASEGPRDVRVALGVRKRLLPTRLGSAVWRQSQLYDVAEISAEIRAWGEEADPEICDLASHQSPSNAGGGEAIAPSTHGVVALMLATTEECVPLADSITIYPPVATIRGSGAVGSPVEDADGCYSALLSILSAATDTPALSIAAQADVLLMLLQHYSPLPS